MDKILRNRDLLYVEANDADVRISFFDIEGRYIVGDTVPKGESKHIGCRGVFYRVEQTLPVGATDG